MPPVARRERVAGGFSAFSGGSEMDITYGNIPMYGYMDLPIAKPEGNGWNNLGKRNGNFIALHRMLGTLDGTNTYFRFPHVNALTDFGIGVKAIDGAKAGYIYRWNDPLGYRAGWASGPVSAPWGDGAAFVAKYGINAVNRDGISMEISGYQDTPIDDFAWSELVWFIAWWADYKKIPYTQFPYFHVTGCSFLIYHREFCEGTGKKCPFDYVIANIDRLITDVKAFMQKYQTGTVSAEPTAPIEDHTAEPEKPVEVVPAPTYARPIPVHALAGLGKDDADTAKAMVVANGTSFVWVNDRVRAIRNTKRYQYAYATAKETGPVIKKGEEFDVLWYFRAADGQWWYLTPWWTRVMAAHVERIED